MGWGKRFTRLAFALVAALAIVATPVFISLHAHGDTTQTDCSICHRAPTVGDLTALPETTPFTHAVLLEVPVQSNPPGRVSLNLPDARGPPNHLL